MKGQWEGHFRADAGEFRIVYRFDKQTLLVDGCLRQSYILGKHLPGDDWRFWEGKMRKVAWILFGVLLFSLAISSRAEAPKCENQKNEMDQAKAAMTAAWDAWRRAMAEVDAARQAERDALKALQDAAGVAAVAAQQLSDAVAATNACHQRNGYGSQCATQEQAEARARDALNRATVARSSADSKFHQASSRVATAERQEASLYTTANRLEKSYLQCVDAYNACLRGKTKFA